jgi:homoserine kinase
VGKRSATVRVVSGAGATLLRLGREAFQAHVRAYVRQVQVRSLLMLRVRGEIVGSIMIRTD